jgi:hypothetical protein
MKKDQKLKQDVEKLQEADLKNIREKGYSDNHHIADEKPKGNFYIMTEFPTEDKLPF